MSKYIFGVDVGGTTIKIGLFDTKGILLDKWEIKTDKSNNGQNILCDITASLNEKIEQKHIQKDNILGVGLGVPGPVDSNGVVYKCVNLGWDVFNVSEALEKLSGLKVKVANDANAAALGEMWQGGGKGYNNVVLITLGTGVGGGIIIDGKIVSGINGAAGELGHMPIIIENGERCGCGKEGCLETVASATGIVRETKKYLKKTDEQSLLRKLENITAKDIFDMANKNDIVAVKMINQLGKNLGIATAHIANTLNPEAFVIGGGVSKAGNILIDVIIKHFKLYAFHAVLNTDFRLATLGNDAGMIGAANLFK